MRRQHFPRAFLSVWSENQFWSECDLPSVVLWLPTHLVRLFFRQFFPRFFPPSFSLKANVWLRALIYAKLPPRWFNPITFDECYLPSSRHRTSLLAYLFVPTARARFSNPLLFAAVFFETQRWGGGWSLIYANFPPCSHLQPWFALIMPIQAICCSTIFNVLMIQIQIQKWKNEQRQISSIMLIQAMCRSIQIYFRMCLQMWKCR